MYICIYFRALNSGIYIQIARRTSVNCRTLWVGHLHNSISFRERVSERKTAPIEYTGLSGVAPLKLPVAISASFYKLGDVCKRFICIWEQFYNSYKFMNISQFTCMKMGQTQLRVTLQFACISLSARAFWIARYFLFLICTDLACAKAAQSFSESGPQIKLCRILHQRDINSLYFL